MSFLARVASFFVLFFISLAYIVRTKGIALWVHLENYSKQVRLRIITCSWQPNLGFLAVNSPALYFSELEIYLIF